MIFLTLYFNCDEVSAMTTRPLASRVRKARRSPPQQGGDTHLRQEFVAEEVFAAHSDHAAPPGGGRPSKRKRKSGSAEHVYGIPVPEGLHEAIEIERGNLSKAESLLGCLAISMEYQTDPVTGPYYPDVAEIARDLVRRSINGLDSLTLKQYLLRDKIKEETGLQITGVMSSLESDTGSGGVSNDAHYHFSPVETALYADVR
jgi:hypothetical protein